MNKILIVVLVLITISCTSSKENYKYPFIANQEITETYHGITISDPYRNIENTKDSIVSNWMKNQSILANKILDSLNGRDSLIKTQKSFNQNSLFRIYGIKKTNDGKYFYLKKEKQLNVAYIAYRDSLRGKEHFLFNPSDNAITKGYNINYIKPNWKGDRIAVSLVKGGDEIGIIVILDVKSRSIDNTIIQNTDPVSFYGVNWLPDDSGFIYVYIPHTNPNSPDYWLETKSVLYSLGTNPDIRNVILEAGTDKNLILSKEDFPAISIYHQEDIYAYAKVGGSSRFKDTYYKRVEDLADTSVLWKPLFKKKHKVRRFIPAKNNLYFLTALNNSNYQLAKTNIHQPDFEEYQVIAEPMNNQSITDYELTKDGVFYVVERNGVEATLYFTDGITTRIINMPTKSGKITISSLGAKFSDLWIVSSGWLNNPITYKYSIKENKFDQLNLNKPIDYSDFNDLEVLEFEIPSHDGVMLPVSIVKQKYVELNSKNPVLLYGYGSYGTSLKPFFNSLFLTWVTKGGLLVIPHVRGGGEKGDKWYKDGTKTNKSNTWKDLIATTEYLIDEKYTNPSKIAVWGTSAGGIMAGKAITTRPELYATAIFISPAMNMLRSEIQPNGLNSIKEFGTVKKEDEFKALFNMDSYHSIKKGVKYPSVYVYAGAKDGRVVVWDPAKFVARLQASTTSEKPILFNVDFESGHGGSVSSANSIYKLFANTLSFALWQTGHPDYQLKE
ncbi:prolyl oligopeptidase family serine peptidase [Dokdonia sp.]|uniref:prolyl oligopeptidase family serine peptidase n=1 Tax=Dokdonia sp. TaxID=2024995 RepID=UPI003265DAD5